MDKLFIAITGGIGSGKSLVLSLLNSMGYPTFSCDEIYKEVMVSPEYIAKVGYLFPEAIENGEINRKKLSDIVFQNGEKLQQLNAVAHPLIMDMLFDCMKNASGDIVFAEVPLLFEGNYENLFHRVIYVSRATLKRVEAVMERDGCSLHEVEKRINSQFDSSSEKGRSRLKKCKAIILENDGNIEELKYKLQLAIDLL